MSVLTPDAPTVDVLDKEPILWVPRVSVVPAPDNPRKDLGDLTDLVQSIKAVGILQPLIVTSRASTGVKLGTGDYLLVIGHRRLEAARLASMEQVPVVIRDFGSDEARIEAMLVENLHREDLTPTEEASGYQQLLNLGVTQDKIATTVGRDKKLIASRLALLGLPPEALERLDKGKITVSDAVRLTKLVDHPKHLKTAASAGNVEWAVERALTDIKHERQVNEAKAKLDRDGVKVFRGPSNYSGWTPEGSKALGRGYGQLPIAVSKHKKEPCHAAALNYTGEITYVCTSPRRHQAEVKPVESDFEKQQRERKAQEKADKKLSAAAAEQRQAFIRAMLKKPAPAAWSAFIARHIIHTTKYGSDDTAWQLLGHELAEGKKYTGDYGEKLLLQANTGPSAIKIAVACILAGHEESDHRGMRGADYTSAEGREAMALLEAAGYTPTEFERQAIAQATRRAEAQERANEAEQRLENATGPCAACDHEPEDHHVYPEDELVGDEKATGCDHRTKGKACDCAGYITSTIAGNLAEAGLTPQGEPAEEPEAAPTPEVEAPGSDQEDDPALGRPDRPVAGAAEIWPN